MTKSLAHIRPRSCGLKKSGQSFDTPPCGDADPHLAVRGSCGACLSYQVLNLSVALDLEIGIVDPDGSEAFALHEPLVEIAFDGLAVGFGLEDSSVARLWPRRCRIHTVSAARCRHTRSTTGGRRERHVVAGGLDLPGNPNRRPSCILPSKETHVLSVIWRPVWIVRSKLIRFERAFRLNEK